MTDYINQGQCFALNKLLEPYTRDDRACRLYVVSQLIGRDVTSTTDLMLREWQCIRDEAWHYDPDADGQERRLLKPEFGSRCAALAEEYREQVLGQQRLF